MLHIRSRSETTLYIYYRRTIKKSAADNQIRISMQKFLGWILYLGLSGNRQTERKTDIPLNICNTVNPRYAVNNGTTGKLAARQSLRLKQISGEITLAMTQPPAFPLLRAKPFKYKKIAQILPFFFFKKFTKFFFFRDLVEILSNINNLHELALRQWLIIKHQVDQNSTCYTTKVFLLLDRDQNSFE